MAIGCLCDDELVELTLVDPLKLKKDDDDSDLDSGSSLGSNYGLSLFD